MFRQLANPATPVQGINAEALVKLRPSDLTMLLEKAWNARVDDSGAALGSPDRRSNIAGAPDNLLIIPAPFKDLPQVPTVATATSDRLKGIYWDHLIYAYMIENTRIYEIFRRVVHEYLHGEKLGVPNGDTQLWLRNTEELFYRDTPPFYVGAINSRIRSDLNASRRNAYQRMFGMDLNHGKDDNSPYPFIKAVAANTGFVSTLEELLREVWIGIVNLGNSSGSRATDDAKIENLASKLRDMLITRRQHGNLSREEFVFVSMMSWFHLTVESDLPVVKDLKAEASSAEERLFKIAQRVGLPAHGLSKSYFDIAGAISSLLIAIETGTLHVPGAAAAFYNPGVPAPAVTPSLPDTMKTIITHWTAITGRDAKAGKVAPS